MLEEVIKNNNNMGVPRIPEYIIDCLGVAVTIFGNSMNLDFRHPPNCTKYPLKSTILAYSEVFLKVIEKRVKRLGKKEGPQMYHVEGI